MFFFDNVSPYDQNASSTFITRKNRLYRSTSALVRSGDGGGGGNDDKDDENEPERRDPRDVIEFCYTRKRSLQD